MAVPELNEPLTIAQAAQRAGVHPNTVRRLIRSGRLRGVLTKGPHGDTWLVDAQELDRLVAGHERTSPPRPAGGPAPSAPPSGPPVASRPWPNVAGFASDEPSLSAAVDLSLDRARALERYTHGLLTPLVDLLREREAAIEAREALIRSQASRIGRLEREVELLRERAIGPSSAQVTHAAQPAQPAQVVPAAPVSPAQLATLPVFPPKLPEGAAPAAMDTRPEGADDPAESQLPQQVVALAGQMDRLRADLRLMASVLETGAPGEPAGQRELTGEREATEAIEEAEATQEQPATSDPVAAPPPVDPVSTSLTPEEMAGLFPPESRARFGREPLQPLQPLATPADPPGSPESDPFAQAEAAVEELRRALAPSAAKVAPASTRPPAYPEPQPTPPLEPEPPAPARRRPWWSLW